MEKVNSEVLAPVGDMEMCRAAVHAGADAIYVGVPGFNARGRSMDFDLDQLREMCEFCHLYGVRVFFALNILIFERELRLLPRYILQLNELGPDAWIIQDIGLAATFTELFPEQVIHASTQMSISCAEAIAETADLNLSRYVLARELSLDSISRIRQQCNENPTGPNGKPAELEVFVHGALCVAYSGQCLTSESFGGRSANRGQCAQSCRLPYQMWVDGKSVDLGEKRYLLSPQDLCTVNEAKELQNIGIESLKIEGRLKSPQYVATAVQAYKAAISGELAQGNSFLDHKKLALGFSRGLFTGWLHGTDHQALVDGRFSDHMGHYCGVVKKVKGNRLLIDTQEFLAPGDGLVFCNFKNTRSVDIEKIGFKIYGAKLLENGVWIEAPDENHRVLKGMHCFQNSSPQIEKEISQIWNQKEKLKQITVWAKLDQNPAKHACLTFGDGQNEVLVQSESPCDLAKNSQIDRIKSTIQGSFGVFKIDEAQVNADLFIHQKELRQLRQKGLEQLKQMRIQIKKVNLTKPEHFKSNLGFKSRTLESRIHLLLRNPEQVDDIADLPIDSVTLDFEYGKDYKEALAKVKDFGYRAGIATIRMMKPDEQHHFKVIEYNKPDYVLVRNLGAINALKKTKTLKDNGIELLGDYSLNICNSRSAAWMFEHGLQKVCPGMDLSSVQLLELLSESHDLPGKFELCLHHYMPTFYMEHCVFAAFLSNGRDFRDCGKPCEKHRVEILDHKGEKHYMKADGECRNTMYRGTSQSALRLVEKTYALGLRDFRIETLFEKGNELRKKVDVIHQVLQKGGVSANLKDQMKILNSVEKYGLTEGQLFNDSNWVARKKEGPRY